MTVKFSRIKGLPTIIIHHDIVHKELIKQIAFRNFNHVSLYISTQSTPTYRNNQIG